MVEIARSSFFPSKTPRAMASPSVPEKWAQAWSVNPPNEAAAIAWQQLYSDNAMYTDHAFQIVRQGPLTLRKHFEIWRTAMPDFEMSIADTMPSEKLPDGRVRYSIRTHNSGTFTGKFTRREPSGNKFYFRGVVDLVVNKDDLIDSIEEWYCSNFDATNGQQEFNFRNDKDVSSL
jgi:hypothetical protein